MERNFNNASGVKSPQSVIFQDFSNNDFFFKSFFKGFDNSATKCLGASMSMDCSFKNVCSGNSYGYREIGAEEEMKLIGNHWGDSA
jgi:hypothetical protein